MRANRVSCFMGSNHQATARKTVTIRDMKILKQYILGVARGASRGMLRLIR